MPKPQARSYTQREIERFIKYLGCWTFANEVDAINRRDPAEYHRLLLKFLRVNMNRQDDVGKWERLAAMRALKKFE